MALISRLGGAYWDLRKSLAVFTLAVKTSARQRITDAAVIDATSGAAAIAHPNGSLNLRSGGPLEYRSNGRWNTVTVDGLSHATVHTKFDDLGAAPTRATGTVTFSATDPTDEDTITVNGVIYTIQAGTLVANVYDINLDATEATQATIFAAAINDDGTRGTDYSLGVAAHSDVSAAASGAVVTLTARAAGIAGNSITLAESSTGVDAVAALLTGGRDGLSTGWILNAGTDNLTVAPIIDTAQAGGVWALVGGDGDGTTAVDASSMVWQDCPVQLDSAGGTTTIEARIRIKSAVTNVAVGFGLTDSIALEEPFSNSADTITSNATDAVGFLYDTSATTDTWWGCAVDSNTDDTGNATTGTLPVADAWQILRIEISNDGATISFFVDNAATAVLALSGAAGVGPDVVLFPYVICASDGTAAKTVDVDWVRVSVVR
jgi:hypothetical protein